jgi:hypothetical protein
MPVKKNFFFLQLGVVKDHKSKNLHISNLR